MATEDSNPTGYDADKVRREAEAHLAEMREKLLRELNWRKQERHWNWQKWFWVGIFVVAALGIIFR